MPRKRISTKSRIVKAAWNLCNHVYRGNKDLNDYILTVIPSLTKEKLTEIFEEHNAD